MDWILYKMMFFKLPVFVLLLFIRRISHSGLMRSLTGKVIVMSDGFVIEQWISLFLTFSLERSRVVSVP